jgi:hypothetical protein
MIGPGAVPPAYVAREAPGNAGVAPAQSLALTVLNTEGVTGNYWPGFASAPAITERTALALSGAPPHLGSVAPLAWSSHAVR